MILTLPRTKNNKNNHHPHSNSLLSAISSPEQLSPEQIKFKLLLLTYKALNDSSPSYITDLLSPYVPARNSGSERHLLQVPHTSTHSYGERAFQVVRQHSGTHYPFIYANPLPYTFLRRCLRPIYLLIRMMLEFVCTVF